MNHRECNTRGVARGPSPSARLSMTANVVEARVEKLRAARLS
ncbi:MAG: hypothetical protein AVDCRST_MAG42-2083 [uncultured Chthoniobacterales bacterium]|uniref:Uncharacterized protein n=1 Tax=uncultured Chthoniobacterales bacterium TaxID=1836801 RepID=A0A6J4IE92_9BACT|nr:MAG: hypothetical protein AVDCRST_MAG42-2083 [uncultured Chthoniobacterales bacterium]